MVNKNLERISERLEELIRRKDSGVFFGVFGTGNILGKENHYVESTGRSHYQFFPEKEAMGSGGDVMPYDIDSPLTINTSNEEWYTSGETLPFFQKKVLKKITKENVLCIVKQNVRGGNPHTNENYDTKECWALAKYLSDDRGGNSYNIGIKAKLKHPYKEGEIDFLDKVFYSEDKDFIELMDKIANVFIPEYNQAIKGWAEYFKK